MTSGARAEACVDLSAITGNVAALREHARGAQVMAVVKADGYGHGLLPAARAALAGGATWLGTAFVEEALALRAAGITAPVLTWLAVPGEGWDAALTAGVDVSAGAPWLVAELAAAAARTGRPARIHLEADTGMSRGGASAADWPPLVGAARRVEADGLVRVVGLWSHLACADEPDHPANARQVELFGELVRAAEALGVDPEVRHLANSAGTLLLPGAHFDLVRPGIAVYGLTPVPQLGGPERFGLRPAMTLRARLAMVRRVAAGEAVSYGHTWTSRRATTMGLVPLGYGDGIPRHASSVGESLVAGRRCPVAGRICMDQFLLDLGPGTDAAAGDEVVLFGPGTAGEPTAQDWADAAGTISYEIVTRLGPRVARTAADGARP